MCQGGRHCILQRGYWGCPSGATGLYWCFLYTEASTVLSGPGKTEVSEKGMDPLLLGTSVVNCIYGSMEVICYKNSWQCSACWMTKVSSTYLNQSLHYSNNTGKYGPTPEGESKPLVGIMCFPSHIHWCSIRFSLRADEVMNFVMVKPCLW